MNKVDLVVIPYNDFLKAETFGFRTRDQHLISEIIKDERVRKVIIVERPRSISTFFQFFRLDVKRGERLSKNLKKIGEKVFIFEFLKPGLSQVLLRHLWFDKVYGSDEFIKKFLDSLKIADFSDFYVLSFNPFANNFAGSIGAGKIIFDIMDNFCFHPEFGYLKEYICKSFEWICSNADLIFCVNDSLKKFLLENYPNSFGKLHVLPNGVSRDLKPGSVPDDIARVRGPRIGYIGVISRRIDFELVEYLARARKSFQFIFIGRKYGKVGRWMKKLEKLGNVHFLGDKHYDLVPLYIASFDVCIIPHRIDEFTLSNDPIKVYEYLYLGKPVVSTNINIADELRKNVFIVDGKESFLKLLDIAVELSGDKNFAESQRNAIKDEMFWDSRAKIMVDKILSV
jgi:glycosyltransferase involved in cell wall biosynthesis